MSGVSGGERAATRPSGGSAPAGLLDAVRAYERALAADDVPALAAAFAPGPDALRGDAAGLLAGHDAITAFRGSRGGAPARALAEVQVRELGPDLALVMSVTAPDAGGAGLVTQVWSRADGGWRILAAHVQGPAPAFDPSVWRVLGDPLVPGAASPAADGSPLPLAGVRVAVKDVVEVQGHAMGAGNPAFLAGARPAVRTAPALRALLDAGASVRGIARTDELAYSVAGRNAHTGTPPNPRVPRGLPGGSTSGPAAAVALGHADLALGTDTAGSIRVPASYQGLWGLRPTHGAVPVEGVLPLAPTFDTVGWIARSPEVLRRAAAATLGEGAASSEGPAAASSSAAPGLVVATALLRACDDAVRDAFTALVSALEASCAIAPVEVVGLDDLDDLPGIAADLRVVQAAEAWRAHGDFVAAHPGSLGEDVAARFAYARTVGPADERAARQRLAERRAALERVLGDRILLLPSTSSPAPDRRGDAAAVDAARTATLALTSLAGVLGRPALSAPLLEVPARPPLGDATAPAVGPASEPVGLCLVGPPGSELRLIDLAASWAAAREASRAPAAPAPSAPAPSDSAPSAPDQTGPA
ncbi:AtzH-like domain-containing protein [Clavibacter sp. km1a]|uniref:AtzH-like domain-containing protein n=1 Tax=Clavibacter sp. km1a TaxID=3459136 RepID=UPI0040414B93